MDPVINSINHNDTGDPMVGTTYGNVGGDAFITTGDDVGTGKRWQFRSGDGRVVDPNGNLLALENETGAIPVGSIIAFGGTVAPPGFLMCDGEAFDPVVYPDLFRLLGNSTTPDLRGMFLRGLDPSGSIDSRGNTRGLLSFEEGSYVKSPEKRGSYPMAFGQDTFPNGDANLDFPSTNSWTGGIHNASPDDGVSGIAPLKSIGQLQAYGVTRPKNVAVNYIIRAKTGFQETAPAEPLSGSELFMGSSVDNGWTKMPNGLIFQWGNINGNNEPGYLITNGQSGSNINFPTPFPNRCFTVIVTNNSSQGDQCDNAYGYPIDNATFYAATYWGEVNSHTGWSLSWFAIGN